MNITPKKRFGQNFLVNEQAKNSLSRVIQQFLKDEPADLPIVEVGPGAGDLSHILLSFGRLVVALEIDFEAVEYLQKTIENSNFRLYQADASKLFQVAESDIIPNDFALVANLPFNVGSRILVDLPIHYPHVSFAVILQHEVAKKISLESDFTLFGAWLNLFWKSKLAVHLPPHFFSPQPNVMSAFLVGKSKQSQKEDWLHNPEQRLKALRVLKNLFKYPRKTLQSNLKNLNWGKAEIEEFFKQNQMDLNTRLTWENYEKILELVLKFKDIEAQPNKKSSD